jgi:hypothetical protein
LQESPDSGYQRKIIDQGVTDNAYKDDGISFFRVLGTGRHNTKVVQVDLVCIFFFM